MSLCVSLCARVCMCVKVCVWKCMCVCVECVRSLELYTSFAQNIAGIRHWSCNVWTFERCENGGVDSKGCGRSERDSNDDEEEDEKERVGG